LLIASLIFSTLISLKPLIFNRVFLVAPWIDSMAISKRQDSGQGWQEKYSNSEESIRLELCNIRSANSYIWSILKEKSKSD
jgi:hypothetical protein